MKIDKIAYEQLYPTGVYANQRYLAEATLEVGDNITECYLKLAEECEKAFVAKNPQINWNETALPQPTFTINLDDERRQIVLDNINNSTSLAQLKIYESDSMKYDLVQEYLNKKKSLQ